MQTVFLSRLAPAKESGELGWLKGTLGAAVANRAPVKPGPRRRGTQKASS